MIKTLHFIKFIFISYMFTLYTWKTHNQSLFSHTFKISLHLHIQGSIFWVGCWDRVSLCSAGCPGTGSVDQDGLELRNLPASVSQVLGLQAYIFPGLQGSIFKKSIFEKRVHTHTHTTCYLLCHNHFSSLI